MSVLTPTAVPSTSEHGSGSLMLGAGLKLTDPWPTGTTWSVLSAARVAVVRSVKLTVIRTEARSARPTGSLMPGWSRARGREIHARAFVQLFRSLGAVTGS
jgi:hypothetical protein